ncbi:MAG: hypothetical protein LKI29_03115 [Bacteroides sp.]|nr:hypothetical protein [Bacteroides sp.]
MKRIVYVINVLIILSVLFCSFSMKEISSVKTGTRQDEGIVAHKMQHVDTSLLVRYLKSNWKTPEHYVVDKFKNHDIIFLSEDHGIKHNLVLIHTLIPLLYNAGIYNLGMEFGASEDQKRLDSLITAPQYSEKVAREIMFDYNVGWAIKEYLDVYKAAWKLNRTLPRNKKKFRIINLSYKFNWNSCNSEAFGIKTPKTVSQIFYKGGTEEYRAMIVKKMIIDKHEKILILTGGLHAFTRYQQPEYDYYEKHFYHLLNRSFGNLVYKMAPQKVFTILLHYPFESQDRTALLSPAMGMIDKVMQNFEDKRTGFDLHDTPLGALPDTSFFSIGHPDFKLGDMADGYIYQKAFKDYEGCTFDTLFFIGKKWTEILKYYPDQDIRRKPKSLDEYKKQIQSFLNIKERYKNIK